MAFSLFSTPQQIPSLFQQPLQQQLQSSPFWPHQQQQQQLFHPQQQFQLFQQQQQQQQQLQQHQQQQLHLFANEKAPASYGTKWADLHPDSQKILLQIEEKILEYRDESQRLDQCSRLYDSSVSSDGFEHDAGLIIQELGGTTMGMERQKALLQELMTSGKEMLRNTEMAMRSFMIVRQRYALSSTGTTSNPTTPSQTPGTASQQAASIVPVLDFYNGLPKKPSPFLLRTVARFEKYLVVCRRWVEELEQLLVLDSDGNGASFGSSLVESLPRVTSNVHDFFVHVTAKVESIHQHIESMKSAYLADQSRRGDSNDLFLEADRRESARQEAAARRAHPTLHLPPVPQPSTQITAFLLAFLLQQHPVHHSHQGQPCLRLLDVGSPRFSPHPHPLLPCPCPCFQHLALLLMCLLSLEPQPLLLLPHKLCSSVHHPRLCLNMLQPPLCLAPLLHLLVLPLKLAVHYFLHHLHQVLLDFMPRLVKFPQMLVYLWISKKRLMGSLISSLGATN